MFTKHLPHSCVSLNVIRKMQTNLDGIFNMQMLVDDAMVMFEDNCNHDGDSVDILTNLLESKIAALVDKHAPFKRVRVRPTRKPWITNTLMKQITYKNRLFKSSRNNASK